ncbi:MAG: hypothetical protein E7560_04395 [Ruminococcaceae bacterium]|nr:hypothetical protein [Oscillospiraceae bacterium]
MKKFINIFTTASFLVVIFALSIAFFLMPDKEFSSEENRSLQAFPETEFGNIADGTFTKEMNVYFADQFVARDEFVGLKGMVASVLGCGENNGVLLGKNEQLAVRLFDTYKNRFEKTSSTDFYYSENLKDSLEKFNEYAKSETLPLITLFPPRTVDVVGEDLIYPNENGISLSEEIKSSVCEESGYIDLLPIFQKENEKGNYVYYKTDHHWTSEGAYIAYTEIMKKWGMEEKIIPKDSFKVEQISDFYGTTWSKAGMKFVPSDILEIWSLGNQEDFITTCYSVVRQKDENGKMIKAKKPYKTFSGYLNREYLTEKNKYAAFLDGTHNEQTVFLKSGEKRERLLVMKDSFADSLVPFLAQHFDLVIINLANNNTNVTEYAKEYNCDRVLFVYNFENLTENNILDNVK